MEEEKKPVEHAKEIIDTLDNDDLTALKSHIKDVLKKRKPMRRCAECDKETNYLVCINGARDICTQCTAVIMYHVTQKKK